MTTKRAYKLQEFVAHTSNVNCLKIGRKSSRVLVTGGEDHKVNLWAIGKPNAILSLSGHTSAIESVSFDSSEVLVAAGAASGTIKLWDLEEAKIVRTLTGHRSNCISVDFHPFGEFFASGSLDTNLKIWDIRRKGCIHTYKGHTRGVSAIRFTPDGRWVVSGGEDNVVKLWDLTAGKLLHDFKSHEGQIQCIDFHPHEFLLATGALSFKTQSRSDDQLRGSLENLRETKIDFQTFAEKGQLKKRCSLFSSKASQSWQFEISSFPILTKKSLVFNLSLRVSQKMKECLGVPSISQERAFQIGGGKVDLNADHTDFVEKFPFEVSFQTGKSCTPLTRGQLKKYCSWEIEYTYIQPRVLKNACIPAITHNGSADRTVKFWDLESFELIDSAGPETTGVRAMTFNPDGRTLLCGLHESLKVFSWEPIRSHDAVDVGWSRLSDLNIHEGKLLGCSYNQSCVGVWVVDISRIEPYSVASATRSGSHQESKSTSSVNLSILTDNNVKASTGRPSVSQNPDPMVKETKLLTALSVSRNSDATIKEARPVSCMLSSLSPIPILLFSYIPRYHLSYSWFYLLIEATGNVPGTPQRVTGPKSNTVSSVIAPAGKRNSLRAQSTTNVQIMSETDVIPVIVPRTSLRVQQTADNRREAGRTTPFFIQSKVTDFRKLSHSRDDAGRPNNSAHSRNMGCRANESSEISNQSFISAVDGYNVPNPGERNVTDDSCIGPDKQRTEPLMEAPPAGYQRESHGARVHRASRDMSSVEVPKGGRTRTLVATWEKKERSPTYEESISSETASTETTSTVNLLSYNTRGRPSSAGRETVSASDEDAIADLMEQHSQFLGAMQSRLTKLQVVRRYLEINDFRGAISAMEKMADNAVLADVVSILTEKNDIVTLDICTCLMPLLTSLLESKMDSHLGISLEMLLKLVKTFGSVIHSSLSASTFVGVDIQAEQRLERCNICFIELQKIKRSLPPLSRRGGTVAKFAQELNLVLQEVV
ncbi:hypothetical protein GIB67_003626 [Kingdonia uniflora]|uniref:Katanin p80 WD40 repeat-containing subunit B1 homolog n=1 Tax=Kingdonia uniflora TaxID=39325 RepID=A0A7J7MEW2_9MAGN|nr:hypothetical protein GIB67_003626 [Kingdonia uniflora]